MTISVLYLVMILRTMYLCSKHRDEISMELGMIKPKSKEEDKAIRVLDNPMIFGLVCGLLSPAIILTDRNFARWFFFGSQ